VNKKINKGGLNKMKNIMVGTNNTKTTSKKD